MLIFKGTMGFCSGVQRAIDLAISSKQDKKVIYTLGKLIHNELVVKGLESIGILCVDEIKNISKGDTILICAHGTTQQNFEKLKDNGANVIDATCPFVKKIHKRVRQDSNNGYNIVIIGDKEHTEVKGIAGWCNNGYQIIQDIKEMDFSVGDKFSIVCQTTFPYERYKDIKNNIARIATKLDKIVVFFDSICYTTVERQTEAQIIAKKSDTVLVIGSQKSSNTKKLEEIAKKECEQVFLITKASDLTKINLENIAKLGILSGASTPTELITEVIKTMNTTSNNDTIVTEEVKAPMNDVEAQQEESTPKAPKEKTAELSMKEGLKKYGLKPYREGMRLKARVVSADFNGILVALETAGKNDTGFIDRDEVEVEEEYNPDNYKPDMELDVIIIPKTDKSNKSINLSKKAYDKLKIDDEKVTGILAGDEFTLVCNQEVKGGLLGRIGTYTVFVPASQIRLGFIKNLSDYTNKPLRLRALPPKEEEEGRKTNPKRIVASQRIILEEERSKKEDEFWAGIAEGVTVKGKVKRFAKFGAFVGLKHLDALVHNSELSWSRKKINSPDEILELNKTYDFMVLDTDRANGKISLGYKQLQPKPEEIALTKYPVGTVTKGKVVRLVKFGAFVELEPGIDGLVHISQINHEWLKSPTEALKVGDEVEVKVMEIEEDRITLSIKELLEEDPQKTGDNVDPETKGDTTKSTDKRTKKAKDYEDEPREYISSTSVVTLADLFNNKNQE